MPITAGDDDGFGRHRRSLYRLGDRVAGRGLRMSTGGTIPGRRSVSGTSNTVTITDAAGHSGTLNCSVTVAPPPSATCVSITAVQGFPITPVTMAGSGGAGGLTYTFTATGLPAGL